MIHKREIYEGEIFTSAESQSHHSAEIWARQNCFSCIFQIKWLGTAHKTPITEENWKEKQMRKHKNIEKFRLEGTPSCHLLQVFPQSRANYTRPSLGFYCLPGWRFPILCLAQCLSLSYFSPLCFVLLLCTSRKCLTASSNTLPQGSWREQENHPQLLLFQAEQTQFPKTLPVHHVLQMPTHPICWTPSFSGLLNQG